MITIDLKLSEKANDIFNPFLHSINEVYSMYNHFNQVSSFQSVQGDESSTRVSVYKLPGLDEDNSLLRDLLDIFSDQLKYALPFEDAIKDGHILFTGSHDDTILVHCNDATIHIIYSRTGQW